MLIAVHPSGRCLDDSFAPALRREGVDEPTIRRLAMRRLIVRVKSEGISNPQVAARVGMSPNRISEILGEMNGSTPDVDRVVAVDGRSMPANTPTPDQLEERRRRVADLTNAGYTLTRIAETLNIGSSTAGRDRKATENRS